MTRTSRLTRAMRGAGAPGTGLLAAALAAVALAAGCSAGQPAQSRATVAACYAFAVQALDQHVTVTSVPPACRGLNHEQINEAVDRAIRAVVGPHRKVVARRLTHREGAYLSYLVTVVPPRAQAPPSAAPSGPSSGLPLRLAALAAWAVTVMAGAWLLSGWLARGGLRRRYTRVAGVPRAVVIGHFSLALTGLGVWIGFLASGLPALAWAAVGVILSVAGLGMATLAGGLPEGHPASDGPPGAQPADPHAPVVIPTTAPTQPVSAESASTGPASAEPASTGPASAQPAGIGPARPESAIAGSASEEPARTRPVNTGPASIRPASAGPGSGGTPPARATAIQVPAWAGKPLAIIALHGTLAAATILLVVLAAVAA